MNKRQERSFNAIAKLIDRVLDTNWECAEWSKHYSDEEYEDVHAKHLKARTALNERIRALVERT